jgi:hypothetical protein
VVGCEAATTGVVGDGGRPRAPVQVVAIATPGSRDWRWRIVDYSGGTMEESRETFASIATALASGTKRLTDMNALARTAIVPPFRPRSR